MTVATPSPYAYASAAGCRILLSAAALLALGACASMVKPVNQEVALRATEGGERVEAVCEVANDKGSWNVVSPLVMGVTRSEKPLTVQCRGPEGTRATRVFESTRGSAIPGSGPSGYRYPATLELALTRGTGPNGSWPMAVGAPAFAAIDDVAKVPNLDEGGRDGYRRFLAGSSPRAFVVTDQGRWLRVNGARGAARVAMDRCQAESGNCRLYAVDDQVVWDRRLDADLVASN